MSEPIKYIEIERTDAYLDHNVSFLPLYAGARQFMKIRRLNLKTTSIIWITCRLRINSNFGELYNPKTPILIWFN